MGTRLKSTSRTSGIRVRTRADVEKVLRRVNRANITSLKHAGGALRLTARRLIRKRSPKFHSAPGSPPFSHTESDEFWGLRQSIVYDVDEHRESVFVGPKFSQAADIGHVHEFGGTRRNRRSFLVLNILAKRQRWSGDRQSAERRKRVPMRYPKRPFMGPALLKIKDRLPKRWADSIS